MSRKVFTAGEVLAAADVNSFLMDQSVMSFAGTAARGSAIPSPVEGMTTFREDTDRLESWTGSQWTSPGDLVLVKSQTIGTGVSSVTVTDAFSSTYDNYKIIVTGGVASGNALLQAFLGTSAPANGYYMGGVFINYPAAGQAYVSDNNATRINRIGYVNSNTVQGNVELYGPFLSKNTLIQTVFIGHVTDGDAGTYAGFLNNSTSFTAFTINTSSGTLTGGTINVYGYRKA